MNIAESQGAVTCKLCLSMLEQMQREHAAGMKDVIDCEIWRNGSRIAGITGKLDYVLEIIDMHEKSSGFEPAIAYRLEPNGVLVKIRELGKCDAAESQH